MGNCCASLPVEPDVELDVLPAAQPVVVDVEPGVLPAAQPVVVDVEPGAQPVVPLLVLPLPVGTPVAFWPRGPIWLPPGPVAQFPVASSLWDEIYDHLRELRRIKDTLQSELWRTKRLPVIPEEEEW